MRRYFARRRQPWVLWHQDVYSLGVAAEAARRLPKRVAAAVSERVQRIEQAQIDSAAAVVAIGEPFRHQYERWGVRADHVRVIPNWAPLDDLIPGERENPWAAAQGLPGEPIRIMYAGTLGRKHNPLLLLELLDGVQARGVDAMLVVVSEGVGADDLKAAAGERSDVRFLGYQPADQLSNVLASSDVLVALLEPDAAEFSVPSKVLSYLSAGRPTIALVPEGNPCADDVRAAEGFVGSPDASGVRQAADWLAVTGTNSLGLSILGQKARSLATERFDINRIGSEFEAILAEVAEKGSARGGAPLVLSSGVADGGKL
jgi:glycosyltransferase involved in cell wall biosynthesis